MKLAIAEARGDAANVPVSTAAPMPLLADQSFLLIVDVQRKLAPETHDPQGTIAGCLRLIKAARILGVPVLMSEHYPEGLGPAVAELRALMPAGSVLDKVHFSCVADDDLKARIDGLERRQAVIAGMEAHVCVLQTSLDLLEDGYRVAVVADAVTSRDPLNKSLALDRMTQAGVEAVSVEMVLFEWLGTAQHPSFRDILALIK